MDPTNYEDEDLFKAKMTEIGYEYQPGLLDPEEAAWIHPKGGKPLPHKLTFERYKVYRMLPSPF